MNGVLVGYRLYYRELQYDSTLQEAKKTINNTSARVDLTGRGQTSNVLHTHALMTSKVKTSLKNKFLIA